MGLWSVEGEVGSEKWNVLAVRVVYLILSFPFISLDFCLTFFLFFFGSLIDSIHPSHSVLPNHPTSH